MTLHKDKPAPQTYTVSGIGKFTVESEWEGFKKLVNEDGEIVIALFPADNPANDPAVGMLGEFLKPSEDTKAPPEFSTQTSRKGKTVKRTKVEVLAVSKSLADRLFAVAQKQMRINQKDQDTE